MAVAFIALGANKTAWHEGAALSPRAALVKAVGALDVLPESYVLAGSGLYETQPIGPGRQRPYVNAVVALETGLSMLALLKAIHGVEATFQRQRKRAWQARSLDLDILDYGGAISPSAKAWRRMLETRWPNRLSQRAPFLKSTQVLAVPHVRLHRRSFVLLPLCELCPNWLHPVFQTTAFQLASTVDHGSVRRLGAITL